MTSKRIERVGGDRLQNDLDAAVRTMPDSRQKRRAQKILEEIRVSLVDGLSAIVASVVDKKLDVDRAITAARSLMAPKIMDAGVIGVRICGLPDWELTDDQIDALLRLVEAEVGFFTSFVEDLAAMEAISREARTELYGGSIGTAFWRGWTMAAPSTASIWWRLSVAEHCPDCIRLASNSPYSKPGLGENPLPTAPRNGDTRCVSNCRCYLVSEGVFDSGLINLAGVEVTAVGSTKIDPMSPAGRAAAAIYQTLAERYVYHTRMSALDRTGGHGRIARRIRDEMKALSERLSHSVRFNQTMTEMTSQVRLARSLGYEFIAPNRVTDDLVLAVATVVAMNSAFRGKITAVTEDPPTVVLDDEESFRVDSVGRNILFVVERP